MLTVVSGASGGLIDNLSSATGSLAVDMWTTQARCPHAHRHNSRYKCQSPGDIDARNSGALYLGSQSHR